MSSKQRVQVDEEGFKTILKDHTNDIAQIAWAARELLLSVYPELHEVVWGRQGIAGYGLGPKKMTEHFCYISPAKAHVTFGFNYGSELEDPQSILEGAGIKFRHVKLNTLKDVQQPQLRALIQAAVKERKKGLNR